MENMTAFHTERSRLDSKRGLTVYQTKSLCLRHAERAIQRSTDRPRTLDANLPKTLICTTLGKLASGEVSVWGS